MKLVSWNVNGIRAAMAKGFREFVEEEQPEVLCIQETKAHPDQVDVGWAEELGYHLLWNAAEKKGYSGTAIWSKTPAMAHHLGMGISDHDREGRVITAEFDAFQLVNVYTPNSQRGLTRLDYRQRWDRDFLEYVRSLNRKKPVIFCGDVNCAHQEIDLANPKANRKNAGFTPEERAGLDAVAAAGFVDSFRARNTEGGHYSWWTYRNQARQRNIGWRLDYFWVADALWRDNAVTDAAIRPEILGSDHCPVELTLG
ncbi:exodeoxyribonuclease III [Roseimaritima sediminicola]|uniref:exodeoxyribonuclease III n=1 Tax=Roseimaritima sediminicola TaxID=2662066 RepID=UPI0012984EBD|nr:exodeoxyribonuclease III [Roseimaritima sediminicola]